MASNWNGTWLITGGAGFLGSHLADTLLANGGNVVVLDDLSGGRRSNLDSAFAKWGDRIEFHEFDVCNNFLLLGSLVEKKFDGVFHLASVASPDDYMARPIKTLEVCSLGIANAVEFAMLNNARLLYTSTSEIYGDPQVHPQPETYWGYCNPYGERAAFDEGKRYAEAYFWASQKNGLDGRMVRLFNAYGGRMKYDDGRVVAKFVGQALRGVPLTVHGDGLQTRSFCYIGDIVNGLMSVFKSDETRPVNLGTQEETQILDLAQRVIKITRSKSKIVYTDPRPDDPNRRRPDTQRAHALGWYPHMTLDYGIDLTAKWARAQGD